MRRLRLAIALVCLCGLSGCYWVMDALDELFGSYLVFSGVPYEALTPQGKAYFDRIIDGAYATSNTPFFKYQGGEVDVVNNSLFMWLMGVPAPGQRFSHWASEDGYLFPGSTDTVISISTQGLTGSGWRAYHRDSEDRLYVGSKFSEISSAEMNSQPLYMCTPYQLLSTNIRITKVSRVVRNGTEFTVRSTRWVTSFRKIGANSVRVTIREDRITRDDGNNQILSERVTQRIVVNFPTADGDDGSVKLIYERVDAESINGEKLVSIVDIPTGVTQFLGSLTLLNSQVFERGGGRLYQGATPPRSPNDWVSFTYERNLMHGGVRKNQRAAFEGGPRKDIYQCGITIIEELNVPGADPIPPREIHNTHLSTDSISFMAVESILQVGGVRETTTVQEATYRTTPDNKFGTWFFF